MNNNIRWSSSTLEDFLVLISIKEVLKWPSGVAEKDVRNDLINDQHFMSEGGLQTYRVNSRSPNRRIPSFGRLREDFRSTSIV